jgi:ribosome-binding protein aMBF1 (putative translation factor)
MVANNSEPPKRKKRNPAKAPPPSVPRQRQIFAANFRRARRKAGLTQRDVHRETGLAQSYICRVEKCLTNISLDNMAKLADLVGHLACSFI